MNKRILSLIAALQLLPTSFHSVRGIVFRFVCLFCIMFTAPFAMKIAVMTRFLPFVITAILMMQLEEKNFLYIISECEVNPKS